MVENAYIIETYKHRLRKCRNTKELKDEFVSIQHDYSYRMNCLYDNEISDFCRRFMEVEKLFDQLHDFIECGQYEDFAYD